jgi:hypothetical protein
MNVAETINAMLSVFTLTGFMAACDRAFRITALATPSKI